MRLSIKDVPPGLSYTSEEKIPLRNAVSEKSDFGDYWSPGWGLIFLDIAQFQYVNLRLER